MFLQNTPLFDKLEQIEEINSWIWKPAVVSACCITRIKLGEGNFHNHCILVFFACNCKQLICALRHPFSSFLKWQQSRNSWYIELFWHIYTPSVDQYSVKLNILLLWNFERDNICLLVTSQKIQDDQCECYTKEIKQPLHTMWHNTGVPFHLGKAQLSCGMWRRRDNLFKDSCVRNFNGGDRIYLFL